MTDGFLEGLLHSAATYAAVQASKGKNGKPDPHKAAGMLFGVMGNLTDNDIAELGSALGAEDAFTSESKHIRRNAHDSKN